jgi:hypothetical protein
MTELQAAIVPKEATRPEPVLWTSTLRRSKSLDSLSFKFPVVTNNCVDIDNCVDLEDTPNTISGINQEPSRALLPSISSLGLLFQADVNRGFHVHGFEELKRCRGYHSSPLQLSSKGEVNYTGYTVMEQDEEARGAASALMELFTQNVPMNPSYSQTAANVLLPSLKLASMSAAGASCSPAGQNILLALSIFSNQHEVCPLSSKFQVETLS